MLLGVGRWTAGLRIARRLILPARVVLARCVRELRVAVLDVVTASVLTVTARSAVALRVAQVGQPRTRRGTVRRAAPPGVVVGRADTRRPPPGDRPQQAPIAAAPAAPGPGGSRALWDVKILATSTPLLPGHRAVRTVAILAGPCRRAAMRPPLGGKDRQALVRVPAELPSREATGARPRPRSRPVDLLGEALSGLLARAARTGLVPRRGLAVPLAHRTGRTSRDRRPRRGRSPSARSVARPRLLRRRDPLDTARTETRARPGSSVIALAGTRRRERWTGPPVSTRPLKSPAVRRGPAGNRRGLRRGRRRMTGQLTRPSAVRSRTVHVRTVRVRVARVRVARVRVARVRAVRVRAPLVQAVLVQAARGRPALVRMALVTPVLVKPGVVRTGLGRMSAPLRTGHHRPHGRAAARLRESDRERMTVPAARLRPLTGTGTATAPGQQEPLAAHGPSRPADPLGRPRRAATRWSSASTTLGARSGARRPGSRCPTTPTPGCWTKRSVGSCARCRARLPSWCPSTWS